ncbi:MAG: hypothetical protein PHF84_09970 [bacterium]|nr:hypothetical protein [bacterium]
MKLLIQIIIILTLFSGVSLYAGEINLFVNYNIVTFSSFDQLLTTSYSNIRLFLEYDPLIPLYLGWNKFNLMDKLKEEVFLDRVRFFVLDERLSNNPGQDAWCRNIKMEFTQKIFSGLTLKTPLTNISRPENNIRILNFNELTNILLTVSRNKFSTRLDFNVDLSLFLYTRFEDFLAILLKDRNHTFNFYIYSDKPYEVPAVDIHNFVDLIYSIRTKKNLNEAETKVFNLTYLLFSIKLFSRIDDLVLNLFPLNTNLPKKYHISSMEYSMDSEKYITIFDKDNFITFDGRNGYLKKWLFFSKGECLINFDSFMEQLYVRSGDKTAALERKDLTYYKFDNGISFKFNYDQSLAVEKNIILQYGKVLLSYKVINKEGKRKNITLQLENKYSPSLYDNLVSSPNPCGFYYIYGKKVSSSWEPEYNNFVNLATGYGINWEFYNAVTGLEFYKGFYYHVCRMYYKFTLLPYEQKVITVAFRKVTVPEKVREKYVSLVNVSTNQYWGDYSVK